MKIKYLIDRSKMEFPFQIDQICINGSRFFDMIRYYDALYHKIIDENEYKKYDSIEDERSAYKIVRTLNAYSNRTRTGDTYVRQLFNCLLMMRYLMDGRIRIDNNLAENAIRPITLGRKNYLFCGDHEAAVSMSVVCSLLATCKAHEVNPRNYLNDVIARMPYMQKASYDELVQLLPHRWKKE